MPVCTLSENSCNFSSAIPLHLPLAALNMGSLGLQPACPAVFVVGCLLDLLPAYPCFHSCWLLAFDHCMPSATLSRVLIAFPCSPQDAVTVSHHHLRGTSTARVVHANILYGKASPSRGAGLSQNTANLSYLKTQHS